MKKYFNIKLEFNHDKLEYAIEKQAKEGKGYCCFVDLNSLVYSSENPDFRTVLNNSFINSCDGSYIAKQASKINKENLEEYIGPDFFKKFIFKEGVHIILGSKQNVFNKVLKKVNLEGYNTENIMYLNVPFKPVDKFDYKNIAKTINKISPNYIWVCLGAPKQEYFMSKLLPFIDKGILIGVGAAINYFAGEIKAIPSWIKKMKIIWIYRAFQEPKKQVTRIIKALIKLRKIIREEKNLQNSINLK
jgi:N-acetylglucosaminyldiphosphoundecaprenol N-acetyl-beta-D-mannosaminyltransferase